MQTEVPENAVITNVTDITKAAGTVFGVKKTVTQSDIVAAPIDFTGVSVGLLELMAVILQNGAVAFASAGGTAVLEIDNDNVNGNPEVCNMAEASLGAQVTVIPSSWDLIVYPMVIEAGKKITGRATSEDFTSIGTADIYFIFRRLTDGATITAA